MSLFSKLFGVGTGGAAPDAPPETYKEFTIVPGPAKEPGGWRIGARIEKEIGGEVKVHQLIRADTIADHDDAITASLNKARQLIDQQGDRLFD